MIAKPIPDFEYSETPLQQMTRWLREGVPFCHLRFADGEFSSILGRTGPNADGQEHLPQTLGKELAEVLVQAAAVPNLVNILFGGDWRKPKGAWQWLQGQRLDLNINWVPPSLLVDGILTLDTLRFLRALLSTQGNRWFVGNQQLVNVAVRGLNATHIRVSLPPEKLAEMREGKQPSKAYGRAAYEDMPAIYKFFLDAIAPNDVVIWCAGLGCKPTAWRLFNEVPGTTHIDCGSFFDLAAGLQSRTWMTEPPDERGHAYRNEIMPRLTGDKSW